MTSEPRFALPPPPPTIGLVLAADVPSKAVPYFWPPAIAFGKVSVILAPSATCTSALIAELAAKASVGGKLPQTQGSVPISDTAIVAAEGSVGERIRPRLDAAGADLNRVHFVAFNGGQAVGVQRFDQAADCKALSVAIRACGGVKLVMTELTASRIDVDIARTCKAVIASYYAMARELDLAIVLLIHPADAPDGRNQLALAANAVAFLPAVGAVGVAAREKKSDRWIVAWTKNVVGHDAPGVAFRIEAKVTSTGGPAACIVWDPEPVAATETVKLLAVGNESTSRSSKLERAKEFILEQLSAGLVRTTKLEARAAKAGFNPATVTRALKELEIVVGSKGKLTALKRAKDFLLAELANGSVSAKSIQRKADAAGISEPSLRRAAEALKIKKRRKGGIASEGWWVWRLRSTG